MSGILKIIKKNIARLCGVYCVWGQANPFGKSLEVRNIDYLIIGECCNVVSIVPSDCSYVQISAPNRSIQSCYEVLKHTHSILEQSSNSAHVVFILKKKAKNGGFTIFDIPFFHEITIKKYSLKNLKKKARIPLLYCPLLMAEYLCKKNSNVSISKDLYPNMEALEFCKERGYIFDQYRIC